MPQVHRYVVSYKQPGEYDSLSEIRIRRRNLRELLDVLEEREVEVIAERQQVKLTSELLNAAKRLHDTHCMKRHVDQPKDAYYECGLGAKAAWDALPVHGDPGAASVDIQWTWVMKALNSSGPDDDL